MNRPNGQQCLAKAIIDHTSLWWSNTNAYCNETAAIWNQLRHRDSCNHYVWNRPQYLFPASNIYDHAATWWNSTVLGYKVWDSDGMSCRWAWESYSNMSNMGLNRQYTRFQEGPTPQKNLEGSPKNWRQGAQLGHTYRPYTGGQLTGYIPVNLRCRTRHGHRDGQYGILCPARFTEPLPDNYPQLFTQ